ncbi:TPA: phage filamentation protein Fil family protein [Citrobacter braakii]
MLKNEPSFASLLVKQSHGMHFGHGWIVGKDGKRWHPSRSQSELLKGLQSKPVKPSGFLIIRIVCSVFKGGKHVSR